MKRTSPTTAWRPWALALAAVWGLQGCSAAPVRAEAPAPLPTPIFRQSAIGSMACGPCALYNSMVAGSPTYRALEAKLPGATPRDRIRGIIDRWGSLPSVTYGGPRARYDPEGGTTRDDLVELIDDLFVSSGLPTTRPHWLDRLPDESQDSQLRRVHALLQDSDFPPIIEVRPFIAEEGPGGRSLWQGMSGHWLSVRHVAALPEGPASGFLITCADSVTGREIPAYAYIERFRPFTATKDFHLDETGKEKWNWIPSSPYLLLTLPDLSLGTKRAVWSERSTIALTYVIRGGPLPPPRVD